MLVNNSKINKEKKKKKARPTPSFNIFRLLVSFNTEGTQNKTTTLAYLVNNW